MDKDKIKTVIEDILGLFNHKKFEHLMQAIIDDGKPVVLTMTADRVWMTDGGDKKDANSKMAGAYDDFVGSMGLYGRDGMEEAVKYGFETGWEASDEKCVIVLKDLETTYKTLENEFNLRHERQNELVGNQRRTIDQQKNIIEKFEADRDEMRSDYDRQKEMVQEQETKIKQLESIVKEMRAGEIEEQRAEIRRLKSLLGEP